MKRMHLLWLCVVLLLNGSLFAQEPLLEMTRAKEAKPLLFGALPEEFDCSLTALQNLFSEVLNEQINTQLSDQLLIKGKIINQSQPVPGTISINIRLENYHNALFNLTARLMPDNSFLMQGRIFHPRYGDALVLVKNRDRYFFKKSSQKLLMPE
ncbi:MAG: hypothetical protein J7497_04565 [Chitinophagaceae bacterium]|nr:hypothetical protein [Chitinophagaceae bacterium]